MVRSIRQWVADLLFISFLLCPGALRSQSGLNTINPPQGGTIVYGQVDGQSTEAGAMGAVLRSVHQNVGEKPQVGKLFQVRGTQSVAAFFSATRRNGNSGQIGGLIIVTKVSTEHVEAALITDEASRFHKNVGAMVKSLFAVWHPLRNAAGASAAGPSAPPAALHRVTLPDNSAAVDLPQGWQVFQQLSGGGTICAGGPNGETAFLGITFLAMDPNNPMAQNTMRMVQSGQLRGSYAQTSFIPFGADPQKTFTYMFNRSRAGAGMPPADFNISNARLIQTDGRSRCTHFTGSVDFKDGRGNREMIAVYCTQPPQPAGNWLSMAYVTTLPLQVADKERATIGAVLASFTVNQQVVAREAGQISGPIIDQIHAIGRAAENQARAQHQTNDIQNSSVYGHWDSMDRRSQEFENYQLGYSVISDNQENAHGTFWNADADALVRGNPQRYEYVDAPDYWKGIDY